MRYKIAGVLTIILIYFFVIRPVRGFIVSQLIYPQAARVVQTGNLSIEPSNSVSFMLKWPDGRYSLYKISGGIFLLLPALALIFARKVKFLAISLITIHLAGILITLLFLYSGLHFNHTLLTIMPVITKYIVPAFSLSLVPLALSDKLLKSK